MTTKKLANIPSSSGTTSVNTKFSFTNKRLLSSMASADKSGKSNSKNVHKVVNAAADMARSIKSPSKTALPAAAAISITKSPNNIFVEPKDGIARLPRLPAPAAAAASRNGADAIVIPPEIKEEITRKAIKDANINFSSSLRTQTTIVPGLITPESDGINVLSLISPKDTSIFRAGSFLVSTTSGDEKFVGEKLKQNEKPRVLSVIEENIKDGYPKSNALIIRRLVTDRGYATKYTIYRKDMFKEFLFKKLTVLESDKLFVPDVYKDYIVELQEKESDVFVIKDLLVRNDTVYIYKVEVDWVPSVFLRNENADASRSVNPILGRDLIRNAISSLEEGSSVEDLMPRTSSTSAAASSLVGSRFRGF